MIVSDYSQMDRIMQEERQYILNIYKKIKKASCNVLEVSTCASIRNIGYREMQ